MTDKDKAELQVKIANEEYGEPDFVPLVTILLLLLVLGIVGALLWYTRG